MPIVAGPVFSATVKAAGVVLGGSESGAIDRFAAPDAVFPDGSVTL